MVIRFGLLVGIVALVLAIYALVDCLQRPDSQIKGLPKFVWLVLIILFPLAGAVGYLWVGANGQGRSNPHLHNGSPAPQGPDDDEDFLRSLRQRAQEQRDEYQRQLKDKQLDEWQAEQNQKRDPDPDGS